MQKPDDFSLFGSNFQTRLLQALVIDVKFFERIFDILRLEFFDSKSHNFLYKKIQEYFTQYNQCPSIDNLEIMVLSENDELLREQTHEILRTIKKSHTVDTKYVKDQAIQFCRNQKMKQALYTSVDLWEKGKYDDIYKIVGDALKAGEENTLGHEYFTGLQERLEKMKRSPIPTGLVHLDEILNGGLSKGELGIIVAGTGIGKCVGKNTRIEIECDLFEFKQNGKVYKFREFDKILTQRGQIYAKDITEIDKIL